LTPPTPPNSPKCCNSSPAGWRDPGRLAASLEEFVGNPAYDLQDLRADLERFTSLLGGSDGERLFGP
jgi:hypothetical protein